jgi:mRNA interferase RelE/StbE
VARYRVELTTQAAKQLAALPREVQRRLDVRILALGDNPRPPGSTKLAGTDDLYRIRAGDYRIVYRIEDRVLRVLVIRLGHRGDVYRGL